MSLETLAASVLGNALAGKGIVRTGEGVIRARQNFYCYLFLESILMYKNIIKMNLNLMVFIKEIIYVK